MTFFFSSHKVGREVRYFTRCIREENLVLENISLLVPSTVALFYNLFVRTMRLTLIAGLSLLLNGRHLPFSTFEESCSSDATE